MQQWVKLREAARGGGFYYVNLEHVSHIFRDGAVTKVFVVDFTVPLWVEETPEQVFAAFTAPSPTVPELPTGNHAKKPKSDKPKGVASTYKQSRGQGAAKR